MSTPWPAAPPRRSDAQFQSSEEPASFLHLKAADLGSGVDALLSIGPYFGLFSWSGPDDVVPCHQIMQIRPELDEATCEVWASSFRFLFDSAISRFDTATAFASASSAGRVPALNAVVQVGHQLQRIGLYAHVTAVHGSNQDAEFSPSGAFIWSRQSTPHWQIGEMTTLPPI